MRVAPAVPGAGGAPGGRGGAGSVMIAAAVSDDKDVPIHRNPPSLKIAGDGSGPGEWPGGEEFRAVEKWVARKLGEAAHERRVATVAGSMFDLTAPLHGLGAGERRLLLLGALVHDVGRCVDIENHPAEGAAMILTDEKLPCAAQCRRALAYLALYHRGAVPEAGEDDVLQSDDDARRLRRVLGLLRAADGLDSRSLPSPQIVLALTGAGADRVPKLRVTCYLQRESAKARQVYTRRKKFRLLEETVGCRVEVDVALAQGLRMVA